MTDCLTLNAITDSNTDMHILLFIIVLSSFTLIKLHFLYLFNSKNVFLIFSKFKQINH